MSMKPDKPRGPKPPEEDPRQIVFREVYVRTGNALQAAVKAGYEYAYAKSHAYEWALRVRVKMGIAVRAAGINEVALARILKRKLNAKGVKWNPKDEKWDKFQDNQTQLKAAEMFVEILDGYPAQKIAGADGGPIVIKTSIRRSA